MTILRLALAIALVALPAGAEQVTAVTPVYSRIVAFPLPDGFVAAFEQVNGRSYVQEFVPQGETVAAWSQMITLLGAQGLAAQAAGQETPATAFAHYILAGYRQACPDHVSAIELKAPDIPGAAEVFAGQVGCSTVAGTDHGEAMVFLVAVSGADVFSLQWARRGPAGQKTPGYNAGTWDPALAFLTAGLRFCVPVAGEQPPYPTCTE